MAKSSKGYFGITGILAVILAIFTPTQVILGLIQRFLDGNIVAFIVRLLVTFTLVGGIIIWIMDIINMATKQTIWRLL